MRTTTWMALAMSATALMACSPKQSAAPTAPPAAPAPVAAVPAPPPTPSEPAPVAPETAPASSEAPASPPAQAATVRFSPNDYPAQERRIAELIANAQSRDPTGDTEHDDAESHDQRMRCATRACILRSYAAQEARLRRWEGSSEIN